TTTSAMDVELVARPGSTLVVAVRTLAFRTPGTLASDWSTPSPPVMADRVVTSPVSATKVAGTPRSGAFAKAPAARPPEPPEPAEVVARRPAVRRMRLVYDRAREKFHRMRRGMLSSSMKDFTRSTNVRLLHIERVHHDPRGAARCAPRACDLDLDRVSPRRQAAERVHDDLGLLHRAIGVDRRPQGPVEVHLRDSGPGPLEADPLHSGRIEGQARGGVHVCPLDHRAAAQVAAGLREPGPRVGHGRIVLFHAVRTG